MCKGCHILLPSVVLIESFRYHTYTITEEVLPDIIYFHSPKEVCTLYTVQYCHISYTATWRHEEVQYHILFYGEVLSNIICLRLPEEVGSIIYRYCTVKRRVMYCQIKYTVLLPEEVGTARCRLPSISCRVQAKMEMSELKKTFIN